MSDYITIEQILFIGTIMSLEASLLLQVFKLGKGFNYLIKMSRLEESNFVTQTSNQAIEEKLNYIIELLEKNKDDER